VEIVFKSNKLKKSLTIPKQIVKSYGNRAKKVSQRMDELKAAGNLSVMKTIPAANCHELKGNRDGIQINEIEDYH